MTLLYNKKVLKIYYLLKLSNLNLNFIYYSCKCLIDIKTMCLHLDFKIPKCSTNSLWLFFMKHVIFILRIYKFTNTNPEALYLTLFQY